MAGGTHKGPADAVIRQVTVDEAFAEDGEGGPVGTLEDRNAGRALPAAGIRLVPPGGKDVQTEPDSRAAANLAARRARQRAQAAQATGKPPGAGAPAPAAQTGDLEDWEIEAQTPAAAPASAPAPVAAPLAPASPARPVGALEGQITGDLMQRAYLKALHTLAALPEGMELFVGGSGLGPDGVEFVMGLGLLVGKGFAVYRGESHYRITPAGRDRAAKEGYGA